MRRHLFNTIQRQSRRFSSTVSLVGKSLLKPVDFSVDEIKSLLWTANELKTMSSDVYKNTDLENKSITLSMNQTNIQYQCSAMNAARFLNIPLKIIVDPNWENWKYPSDMGRILGKTCDLILLKNIYHSKASELAESAGVPVVVLSDRRYGNLRALSDIFTLREQFGYLENLEITWIGSPSSLINTYLYLMARFGVKIKYICLHASGEKVTPSSWFSAKGTCRDFRGKCREAVDVNDALKGSKVLAFGRSLNSSVTINDENCKLAHAQDGFFVIHSLPRKNIEICPKIFGGDRNLTWASYKNYQWVLAAVMLRTLCDFKHVTCEINYEYSSRDKKE